jgi:hypothetical protein
MNRTNQPFDPSSPVKVYWNLHRHLYSVQQNGLVVGHAECVALNDATFKVSQAGRNRVLNEKRKNVHAFIIGTIVPSGTAGGTRITYNPYKYSTFVTLENECPVFKAKAVTLEGRGVIHAKI